VKDEKGAPKIIDEPEQYDALITNEEGICLAAFGADCLVNFYLDPEKRAVGISHGGWRGILNGIDREVISAMMREFGTNPKDVQVGVSPSIGPCCFEVDAPVRDEFAKKLPWCARHILPGEKEGKYMIDLWKINRDFLINLGVPLENIYLPDYCTKCQSDVFFSHRAMGDIRGGQGGFIVL
ncbi:MAG: laccase domain-containing protein, partial [Firmicutes bacterium]|nr:laccase domain-containing protein [Bacillota bacterium]